MAEYANSRLVEWGLLLFSTFLTIVLICNVVEYSQILNGPENPYFSYDSARYWLVVNIILLLIAIIYWLYRVYHFFFTQNARQVIFKATKEYLTQPYTGIINEVPFKSSTVSDTNGTNFAAQLNFKII